MNSEKVGKSLVGCEVVLNPRKTAMYVDSLNGFTLSFFKDGKDRIKITEPMNTSEILKNVKFGILNVLKGDRDISSEYGAIKEFDSRKPLVTIPVKANPETEDAILMKILNTNIESDIINRIANISDFAVLSRLAEIEKQGQNPTSNARPGVLNAISTKIKTVSGMSRVTRDVSVDETITVK